MTLEMSVKRPRKRSRSDAEDSHVRPRYTIGRFVGRAIWFLFLP